MNRDIKVGDTVAILYGGQYRVAVTITNIRLLFGEDSTYGATVEWVANSCAPGLEVGWKRSTPGFVFCAEVNAAL